MILVVADTSPIHYLVLIEAVQLLPQLCDRVILPRGRACRTHAPGRSGGGEEVGRHAASLD